MSSGPSFSEPGLWLPSNIAGRQKWWRDRGYDIWLGKRSCHVGAMVPKAAAMMAAQCSHTSSGITRATLQNTSCADTSQVAHRNILGTSRPLSCGHFQTVNMHQWPHASRQKSAWKLHKPPSTLDKPVWPPLRRQRVPARCPARAPGGVVDYSGVA